jgi:asparagine synthase (glutamine-hydrolysing)
MPGIFGLIDTNPAADVAAISAVMAGRMRHYPWYLEHCHVDISAGLALGRISLGIVNTAEQPARNEDGSLWAVMEGELYDYEPQRRELTRAGHQFRGDSHVELLLHGYEDEGMAYFRRLNGTFAAAIWDAEGQRLVLVTDRFGMKPLYYAAPGGKLVWASEIKAVLADPGVSRRLNPRGIAQFFSFGHFFGDDTLLDSVRVVPAAGWLTYSPVSGRLDLRRYWSLDSVAGAPEAPGADALDRIDEAFQRAVDRRVGGGRGLGISLSGGLDARTIFAAVDHERVPLTSVSIGVEGSLDHVSATRIAEIANRPHHQYHLEGGFLSRFEEHMRRMVHLTDGHYLCQCIVMPSLPVYRELGIEVLLRGHAGELMHMNKAYNFSLDRRVLAVRGEDELQEWLFRRLSAYMVGAVTDPLFALFPGGSAAGVARDSLQDCLRESAGVDPLIHRVWHLFISQRLRRETALSMTEFGSLMETRLPYLDHDLVEALLAIPPEMKLGDQIQSHILRRRKPEFLDVVNSNTGARLGAGALERSLAKGRLKVLAKLGVRGYQPYERLGAWLRKELRPLVDRLLLSGPSLERGIFDPRAVRAVVDQHASGRRNHTFMILALMIFETGQRELVDGAGAVFEPEVLPSGTSS